MYRWGKIVVGEKGKRLKVKANVRMVARSGQVKARHDDTGVARWQQPYTKRRMEISIRYEQREEERRGEKEEAIWRNQTK